MSIQFDYRKLAGCFLLILSIYAHTMDTREAIQSKISNLENFLSQKQRDNRQLINKSLKTAEEQQEVLGELDINNAMIAFAQGSLMMLKSKL